MVIITTTSSFEQNLRKIKDSLLRKRLQKQIAKIIAFPEIGKPMMYNRKGTREVYISPYRLSYMFLADEDRIIFLSIYHKDDQ